jgi:HEAT repeat protein
MPREQLAALTANVDRLLAAGASAAAGNDNLRRRARTLREMGQKVAALNPVADAIDRVSNAAPSKTAPALLDLVVLTRQIRASLSSAGVAGELRPLPESGPWQTPLPVRDVQPLVEALTQSGPGRETLLKDTLQRNAFADLRLVSGLLEALDDGHAPIAELVAREALPSLSRAVLPDLLAGLNLDGKTADARRLLAICRVDPKLGADLCRKALADGSQVLRVQALECLPDVGMAEEAEKAGMERRLDKSRDVRAAAMWALRNSSADAALDALLEALVGDKDAHMQRRAVDALALVRNPKTTKRLLEILDARLSERPKQVDAPKKRGKKAAASGDASSEHVQTTSMVIEALGSRRDKQRIAAAEALLPLARGKQPTLRQAALVSLGAIGAVTGEIVPTLAEAVADKNDLVAHAAVGALARLTPKEREDSLPALFNVLAKAKGKDSALRSSIIAILPDHMDRHGEAILDLLADAMKENDWRVAHVVSEALQRIGLAAKPLLPDLIAACKSAGGYYYHANRSVMAAIDPDGKTAIPELVKLLSDRKPALRTAALELLGPYGKKAQGALPLIEKLCDDKEIYVRQSAERAVAAIR